MVESGELKSSHAASSSSWLVTYRGKDGKPQTMEHAAVDRSDLFRQLEAKRISAIQIAIAAALVLAATENGWAFLNVAPILADSPAQDKIDGRIIRVTNRLLAYINGAYELTMMPQCVLKEAHGIDGIDKLICRDYSPEAFSKVSGYLAGAGYKQAKRGTCYDACEEGWAPSPTNDVQKAIWDKVHQMPTKPIKIVPESKRRKK